MLTLLSSDGNEFYFSKQMILHKCKVTKMINTRDEKEILELPFNNKQIEHFLVFFETGVLDKFNEKNDIIEYLKDICLIGDYLDYDPSFCLIKYCDIIDMILSYLNEELKDVYNDFLLLTCYYKYLKINKQIDMNDTDLEPIEIERKLRFINKDKTLSNYRSKLAEYISKQVKRYQDLKLINKDNLISMCETDIEYTVKYNDVDIDWNDIYNVLNLKGEYYVFFNEMSTNMHNNMIELLNTYFKSK